MSAETNDILIDPEGEKVLLEHAAFVELVLRLVDVTVIFSILHGHTSRHPCASPSCRANVDLIMAEAEKISEEFRELAEAVLSSEGMLVRGKEFIEEHHAAIAAATSKQLPGMTGAN